ncbi:hypothetical protein [Plantibacter sp. PA-3-X8]|uniref:hypothetical protein n=1 Tax=Plantibacter sp. PA-3-X8 TaxID=2480625 RepID=UPI001F14F4C2|nr:hypothetical protein [Plantibacter sp. PA-3-X8]
MDSNDVFAASASPARSVNEAAAANVGVDDAVRINDSAHAGLEIALLDLLPVPRMTLWHATTRPLTN